MIENKQTAQRECSQELRHSYQVTWPRCIVVITRRTFVRNPWDNIPRTLASIVETLIVGCTVLFWRWNRSLLLLKMYRLIMKSVFSSPAAPVCHSCQRPQSLSPALTVWGKREAAISISERSRFDGAQGQLQLKSKALPGGCRVKDPQSTDLSATGNKTADEARQRLR